MVNPVTNKLNFFLKPSLGPMIAAHLLVGRVAGAALKMLGIFPVLL